MNSNLNGIENKNKFLIDMERLKIQKEKINILIGNLYKDKISQIISQDTFSALINKYEEQKQELIAQIEKIQIECETEKNKTNFKNIARNLLLFENINEENRVIVFKLIDKIIIFDNNIEIRYKFNNIK